MTLLVTFLVACSSTPAELTPESAAALADQIAANPSGAEKVLTDAGTDAATYEAYLYTVAADPALTKAYLGARKR